MINVVHRRSWDGSWFPAFAVSGSIPRGFEASVGTPLVHVDCARLCRLNVPREMVPMGLVTAVGPTWLSASWTREPDTDPRAIMVENGLLSGSSVRVLPSGSYPR